MKKILYIMLAAISCLQVSCSLDENDYTEVEKSKYLKNAREARDVLLGVYSNNTEEGMYGHCLSILLNLGTDISQVEGSGNENFRIVPTNSFPSTQKEIQDTWRGLFKGVYMANDFLQRVSVAIDKYSFEDRQKATIYIAEARALRAMYYFELVRRFGHVPLFQTTAEMDKPYEQYEQTDPVKVYEFIEKELQYASKILPYATDDPYRVDNSYRFSKGAALGLLTKVYATWAGYPIQDHSKWEAAVKTAKVLVDSNKHHLLPKFVSLWENTANGKWDPAESLIEISFYSPTISGRADPVGRIGKWNGVKTMDISGVRGRCAGNVKVVAPFAIEWREHKGDSRYNLSIANYNYDKKGNKQLLVRTKSDSEQQAREKDMDPSKAQVAKQNYTPAKWDQVLYEKNPVINNDNSNINWYFLRYADVLLLYAEAINEANGAPTEAAYAAINSVRRRAFQSTEADLPNNLSQEEFREAVRKERAYELAFEGHRRMDLVRWGIYYETIQNTKREIQNWWSEEKNFNYVVAGYTIKGKHELLPIPQRDMDLCKKFKQNPNW